ncbi:MAG: hypothetical protein ICV63_00550 [Coleofasciculus sp. Co-bin14]|nr:hypothetical protein [Coleofasciculus sp. Co-bin14]
MTQARIVLRDTVLERGEQLLEVTKLGSLTELINVMFARYGRHLEETWEVKPMFPSLTQPETLPDVGQQAISPQVEPDFQFNEPLTGL